MGAIAAVDKDKVKEHTLTKFVFYHCAKDWDQKQLGEEKCLLLFTDFRASSAEAKERDLSRAGAWRWGLKQRLLRDTGYQLALQPAVLYCLVPAV